MAAAAAAADMVLGDVLNPARCARLVEFHTRDKALPSLESVLGKFETTLVRLPSGDERASEIQWTVQHVYLSRLIQLADSPTTSPGVLARAEASLLRFASDEQILAKSDPVGHARYLAAEASRFPHTKVGRRTQAPASPSPIPGPPIGD